MKSKGTLVISVVLCVLISAFIFSSCSKSKTNTKLVGKWKLIDVANIKDTTKAAYETWEFTEEYKFLYSLKRQVNHHDSIVVYEGRYSVDKYNKVTIQDFPVGYEHLNGTWTIVKCKDGKMMIVNDIGGLYFREFIKM